TRRPGDGHGSQGIRVTGHRRTDRRRRDHDQPRLPPRPRLRAPGAEAFDVRSRHRADQRLEAGIIVPPVAPWPHHRYLSPVWASSCALPTPSAGTEEAMGDLKLVALDSEDLKVISAHVQDAVLQVGEMAYRPAEHRFAAIANRF